MKKLVKGIVEFRRTRRETYRENFGQLSAGQNPDTLFIACSDSRVVPNTFASTNPGELFVLRNVGNMVAPSEDSGLSTCDESEAAAIEFSVLNLGVRDIVVCGHSDCGAMKALIENRAKVNSPNLRSWLRHGDLALSKLRSGVSLDDSLAPHNQLSQLNVLLQMEHVLSYPAVRKRVQEGILGLHGWWFDLQNADVYYYQESEKRFVLIDEEGAEVLLERLVR